MMFLFGAEGAKRPTERQRVPSPLAAETMVTIYRENEARSEKRELGPLAFRPGW